MDQCERWSCPRLLLEVDFVAKAQLDVFLQAISAEVQAVQFMAERN